MYKWNIIPGIVPLGTNPLSIAPPELWVKNLKSIRFPVTELEAWRPVISSARGLPLKPKEAK